jgi:type IV pilus assembly protein PilC
MIDAGLPLVQCLEILGKQEPHKNFAAVILKVREDVESGAALADAMKKHPKTFDALYSNMIAAGEAGGILDTILKRLAVYIEKNVKLKGEVKSAMIYPVAVIVIAAIVVAAILWKVIPTFASLFSGLGAQLPMPTRVVIAMSNMLVAYGWVLIIIMGLVGYAVKSYYATVGGRHMIDAILLKLPILGNILRKVAVARFCRTLSTLLASGVPILDGLDITARTAGNAVIEDAVQTTRTSIERGETISQPLKETGALDAMLSKIADFYEDEVDTAVAGLLTLMEPVMIAFLGVIVGGIVIAMYLPIFDLISKLT